MRFPADTFFLLPAFHIPICAMALGLAGCESDVSKRLAATDRGIVNQIGARLDGLADVVENQGTITMSSPFLLSLPEDDASNPFAFDLTALGPAEYFERARSDVSTVSRSAFSSNEVLRVAAALQLSEGTGVANAAALALLNGEADDTATARTAAATAREAANEAAAARLEADLAGAALETDPVQRQQREAQARSEHATRLEAIAGQQPSSSSVYAALVAAANARLESDLLIAEASSENSRERAAMIAAARERHGASLLQARAVGTGLTDQTPTLPMPTALGLPEAAPARASGLVPAVTGSSVPVSSALVTAAGNTVREGVLRVLGSPANYHRFAGEDKHALLGVAMVSVDPGIETHSGFRADVSCRVGYRWVPARPAVLEAFRADADELQRIFKHDKDFYSELIKAGLITVDQVDPSGEDRVDPLDESEADRVDTDALLEEFEDDSFDRFGGEPSAAADSIGGSSATSAPETKDAANNKAFSYADIPSAYRITENVTPLVAAVSPFSDVESADLSQQYAARKANAFELNFAFEALGYGAAANAMRQYTEQLDRDLAQRIPLATVLSYSNAGGVFGFSVTPSRLLEADRNPKKQPILQDRLRRQSFPALVLIGLDQDDVQIKFRRDANNKLHAFEPALAFDQTSRWIPLNKRAKKSGISETEWAELATRTGTAANALGPDELLSHIDLLADLRNIEATFEDSLSNEVTRDNARATLARIREQLNSPIVEAALASEAHWRSWKDVQRGIARVLSDERLMELTNSDKQAISSGVSTLFTALRDEESAVAKALRPLRGLEALRARETVLEMQVLGSTNYQAIPSHLFGYAPKPQTPKPRPTIERATITRKGENLTLFVAGQNFPTEGTVKVASSLFEGEKTSLGTEKGNQTSRSFEITGPTNSAVPLEEHVFVVTFVNGQIETPVPAFTVRIPPARSVPADPVKAATLNPDYDSDGRLNFLEASDPDLIRQFLEHNRTATQAGGSTTSSQEQTGGVQVNIGGELSGTAESRASGAN